MKFESLPNITHDVNEIVPYYVSDSWSRATMGRRHGAVLLRKRVRWAGKIGSSLNPDVSRLFVFFCALDYELP